jgi:tRNA A-37 threonylcarbamoyl transferase component Bud32
MGMLHIHSDFVHLLRHHSLRTFNDFFYYDDGETIGTHPTRSVSKIRLGGLVAYLKREFRRPLKEYLGSWWAGFGWVSKSRREWRVLRALQAMGIGCPEAIAVGEENRRAFLLIRALPAVQDLQSYLTQGHGADWVVRRQLARYLGEAVARLHEAGFTHPDVYAKHVFVDIDDQAISFIDFQRTRFRRWVRWSSRWRDLAALNASLSEGLVSTRDRLACLSAYLRYTGRADGRTRRLALGAIARRTEHLLRRRKIRNMHRTQADAARARIEYHRIVIHEDPLRAGTMSSAQSAPGNEGRQP